MQKRDIRRTCRGANYNNVRRPAQIIPNVPYEYRFALSAPALEVEVVLVELPAPK